MSKRKPRERLRDEHAGRPAGESRLLAILVIVVAGWVVACYWPVLSCQALSVDDNQYLTKNALVQNPGWESAGRFLREVFEPSTVRGYYQPLTMISLMIDYALGGRADDLGAFHRTSLALHVLNTVLICVLLYLLFRRPWVAALVGLLFGVHPLTVEPVAWLAERKTMLATFFALICLVLHVLYTRRFTWKRYVGCAAALIPALMSKPTTTALPIIMLLLDYWPLRRLGRRAVLEKIPLLAISVVAAIITIISQHNTSKLTPPSGRALADIVLVVCHNIVFYLYKIVWPAQVSGNYPYPQPLSISHPMVLAGLLGTFVLIALLLIVWRWTRAPLTGWLIFFVAIFPTLGVVKFTNVIAADKFTYLPLIGFLLVPAWGLGHLWGSTADSSRKIRRIGVVVIVLLCAGLATAGTRAHLVHWRDSISIYRYMLRMNPNSTTARHNLGLRLVKHGQHAEAAEHFAGVLQRNPRHERAQRELGLVLERLGRIDEAIPHYQQALRLKPNFVTAHIDMGRVRTRCGDLDAAVEHYRQAARIRPNFAPVRYALGAALFRVDRLDEAINEFLVALRLDPDHGEAREALARAMRLLDRSGD